MEPNGIGLFKLYCAIMSLLYGSLCLLAVAVPLLDLGLAGEDLITFGVMGLVSFPLLLGFAYGFVLPQRKWAWVYGLVLIALGLGSCCFWPICIPLLIKWIEPEFRGWFEAGTDGSASSGWN